MDSYKLAFFVWLYFVVDGQYPVVIECFFVLAIAFTDGMTFGVGDRFYMATFFLVCVRTYAWTLLVVDRHS